MEKIVLKMHDGTEYTAEQAIAFLDPEKVYRMGIFGNQQVVIEMKDGTRYFPVSGLMHEILLEEIMTELETEALNSAPPITPVIQ